MFQEPDSSAALSSTCPLCHTANTTITLDQDRAGAHWVCTRCGQTWDEARLKAAASYARYVVSQPALRLVESSN